MFLFLEYWKCKFGARCHSDHVPNPDVKPRIMVSSIQPGNPDDKVPTPFPSHDCLDDASSDQVLVPFPKNMRLKTVGQVEGFLTSAKKNRSIKNVIQVEELLLAITSSSQQNDRWVQHTSVVVENG